MADLTDRIEQAAADPKSATSDGQSATDRDLDELIKADQYLKGTETTGTTGSGFKALRPARVIPPGAGPE